MANSQQFYNRLNQLAGTNKKVNESTGINKATLIDFEKANDGTVLGVIKENHNYHVKVSKKGGNEFSVADFTYIGGLSNKTDNAHPTLSEAQKQRNYKLKSLNEAFSLTGKAHLIQESVKSEKTSLGIKEDVGSFLSGRIKQGKKNIHENREINFKSSLSKEKENIKTKSSLMNEVALTAIQRALGKINEEESLIVKDGEIDAADSIANKTNPAPNKSGESLITKDGEINAGDSIANKTNPAPKKSGQDLSTEDSELDAENSLVNQVNKKHEPSQAPINDTNAKSEADKNGGSMNESESLITKDSEQDTKNSIANKTNPPPKKSGKDLSTEDSELNSEDSLVNKTNPAPKKSGESLITKDGKIVSSDSLVNKVNKKHEPSQAPINDTNAKKEAGKNGGSMNEADDLSTADSDQEDSDIIANEDGHESIDSYDTHYHPEKGHKEKKGEELKPIKQKGSIVAEGDDLSTADSDQDTENSVANKTNAAPKKSGESLITKDGEVDATKSVANEANKPKKKSGKDLSTADSEQDTKNSIANKVNVRESVEGALAAAKDKEEELDAVEPEADAEAEVDVVDPIAGGADVEMDAEMGDPADAGEEDTSDIDIDSMDLDVDGDADPMGGEMDAEMSVDGPEGEMDAELDVDADPMGGDPAGEVDPMVKELEKLVGKTGQAAGQVDLEPEKADELFSALIGNFEKNLAKAGPEKGQEWSDKIEKITAGEGVSDDPELDIDAELDVDADPMGGDMEADNAIDQQIDSLGGDGGMQEDTPPLVNGEPLGDEVAAKLGMEDPDAMGGDPMDDELEEGCNECGTFESYCGGQGADMNSMSGMEIADLISGYADAHKEGQNDGDFEGVAVYLGDPQVKQDVSDYGHEDYVAQAEPFIKNIGESGVKFGMHEPMINMGEDDEDPTDDASAEIDDVASDVVGDVASDVDDTVANDAMDDVADDVVDAEAGVDAGVDAGVEAMGGMEAGVGEEPPLDLTNLPQQPEPTFGLGAEVMGGGMMKPETAAQKSVDVDLQTGKVIVTMNEEEKLRKIIRLKLDQKFGKTKSSINESKKSKSSKIIDKMITEQLSLYEKVIGKKIGK